MRPWIALFAGVAAALPATAAMAPQYRWQLEFPAFVLEPDPSARRLSLQSLALDLRCAGECVLTSVYTLSSGGMRRARLVLPATAEPAPRIEAGGASARIGAAQEVPRPTPAPTPPGPIVAGGDTLPPRGRADVATRAIDVAFTEATARTKKGHADQRQTGVANASSSQTRVRIVIRDEIGWPGSISPIEMTTSGKVSAAANQRRRRMSSSSALSSPSAVTAASARSSAIPHLGQLPGDS